MKNSSWSIHDFPPEEGEVPAPVAEKEFKIVLTSKELEARRFAAIRNRRNRNSWRDRLRNKK